VTVSSGTVSAPVLSDALAVVECSVREAVTGGTHRVFLAAVVHAQARDGSPLAYYRGKFGTLQEAYGRLSIADLMSRALTSETSVNPRMADDHLALVDAYESADVAEVRRIIRDHNTRAKQNQRADLAALAARSAASPTLPSQNASSQAVSSQAVSSQAVSSQPRET
jgi:Flavin reductase like domain